jgi:hypothetical protein
VEELDRLELLSFVENGDLNELFLQENNGNSAVFVEDQNDSDVKISIKDDQLIQQITEADIDKIFSVMDPTELKKLSDNTGRTIKALKTSYTRYGAENILKWIDNPKIIK